MATNKYASLDLGTIEAVFNKLGGIDRARCFLRGELEVVARHIISLDRTPFIPNGWKIEVHRQSGQFAWDPTKIGLYFAEKQISSIIAGHELRHELKHQLVLNANVLDYLLVHPELIPENWKDGKFIFFWDTVYSDDADRLYVRFLRWNVAGWTSSARCLDVNFGQLSPAAILTR